MQVVVLGLFYSYGTLFAALKADTGDAASTLALVGSIRDFVFGLSTAPAGFLVRRVGFVRMPAIGAAMLLLGMLLDSYAPSSALLFLSTSLVGGMSMAMIFTPGATVLYGHTSQLGQGFLPVAVGLASSGAGLGTILVNLGLDMLLDTFSWRDALRICCGAFCPLLFGAVLALWWGLRQQPCDAGDSAADYQELKSNPVRDFFQPYRDLRFILFNIALLFYFIGFMVPYTHLVYFAEVEKGLEIAGELTSLLGAAGTAARLFFGLCSSFVRPSRLFLLMLLVQGASLIWLPFCTNAAELKLFSAIYGFSSGGRVVLLSLTLNELFDPEKVAHLYGLLGVPMAVGTALGPTFVGTVYDLTGSYDNAFFTAGCIVLLAAPVFCFVCFRKKASSGQPSDTSVEDPERTKDWEQPPSEASAARTAKCSL
ncbi:SLC16A13 [Symbiodinium natans]|uniref:SLC16A13 protein n=1 Tax=Symbiodinium natans TaxID=878477 RepID=A0A812NAH2_9DINO|nr:SLC16A13 [Symbiodinium natans]